MGVRGRTPAVVVAALAVVAAVSGCGGGAPTGQPPPAPTAVAPGVSVVPSDAPTEPSGTPSPARPDQSAPTQPPSPGALRPGARGAEVTALQQRLLALGFWLGPADGTYGAATTHAVTAFQKTAELSRDGVAGAATLRALAAAARPAARSTIGRIIEVDLRRQVLLLVRDGRVEWVFDASTGRVPGSTPGGRFTVYRQVDGYDRGPLGVLYRPKYFVRGVAVHGYPSVPAYPASHGCVRVTNAAMDWIWANQVMPVGQPVWVY